MTHPDPRVAEILERNARAYTTATTAPPADLADDPAAYMAWLRDTPARTAAPAPQRPRTPRTYIDRSQIPRKWRDTFHVPAEPHAAPAQPFERPPGYDDAVTKLRRLTDCGAASMEAARVELGDGSTYAERVLYAAAHPVTPPADNHGHGRTTTDITRPDAPACACGTVLDPDGTCWTCTTASPA